MKLVANNTTETSVKLDFFDYLSLNIYITCFAIIKREYQFKKLQHGSKQFSNNAITQWTSRWGTEFQALVTIIDKQTLDAVENLRLQRIKERLM